MASVEGRVGTDVVLRRATGEILPAKEPSLCASSNAPTTPCKSSSKTTDGKSRLECAVGWTSLIGFEDIDLNNAPTVRLRMWPGEGAKDEGENKDGLPELVPEECRRLMEGNGNMCTVGKW